MMQMHTTHTLQSTAERHSSNGVEMSDNGVRGDDTNHIERNSNEVHTHDWQVTVDFKSEERIDEEQLFELMETYNAFGASAALAADGLGGSLTLTLSAGSPLEALTEIYVLQHESDILQESQVIGVEVLDWQEARRRNREPLYPQVVGYAEIAKLAHVSRQRAAQFSKILDFPKPVIETAQGKLYAKDAVLAWVSTRNTHAGRPKRAHA